MKTQSKTREQDPALPIDNTLSHEEIALAAYHLWKDLGGTHGHDVDDWLRAEKQCTSAIPPAPPILPEG